MLLGMLTPHTLSQILRTRTITSPLFELINIFEVYFHFMHGLFSFPALNY